MQAHTHARKQAQNSPPRSLVLLQVPGCSSFGKSGPGCMALRGKREGDLQIAILEDSLALLWMRAAQGLALSGRNVLYGYVYRSGIVTRSSCSVRSF